MDNNADLGALFGENARILLFIQKCPQFSQKLSASIACMLGTFSMSALALGYLLQLYLDCEALD